MKERLRAFGRRVTARQGTQVDPSEAELVRVASTAFGFLVRDWGCRMEVSGVGSSELIMRFLNQEVGVEITFAEWGDIFLKVIPLSDGRLPAYFDERFNDLYTGFPLDDYLAVEDPSWQRLALAKVGTADEAEKLLRLYAEALARHGGRLLAGDPGVLAEMRDRSRRRLIEMHLGDWRRFVERVRTGFDGPVAEYTSGITARSQLESFLAVWEGSREQDPVEEIGRLDGIFEDATEPIAWGKGKNVVLPSPNARRWWRRPKWLIGSLREYFREYAV